MLSVGETGLLLGTLLAVWADMGALTAWGTEVRLGTSGGVASQEEGTSASWALHDELIEGKASATSLGDSCTGGFGEAETSNGKLWNIENTLVIGDGTNNNSDSVLLLAEVLDDLGQGKWWAVGAGSNKSSQDGLGEAGSGSSGEESEQLDEKVVIQVLGSGDTLVLVLGSASVC